MTEQHQELRERLEADAAWCAERVAATPRQIGRDCAEAAVAISTLLDRCIALEGENARLRAERDTPEVADFAKAAQLEAWHQRERWGAEHDAGKTPFDWFWLVGYLAQKAAAAAVEGNIDKALHHTISTAAALANWHLALTGADTRMRPGIDPEREQVA